LYILSTYIDFFYLFPHFQLLWQAFLLIYMRLFLFFTPAYNSTNQCFFVKKAGKRNGGLHFKKNVSFLSKESPFFLL